jgi:hypothetical protein
MFMCPRKSINEEEKGNSPRRKISCVKNVKIILVEYLSVSRCPVGIFKLS